MKYFIYLLSVIILLGLNLGIFGQFPIFGQIPNLLFLLVIFFALEKRSYDFFFVGFVCGLFLDFFSANYFGSFTLSFLAVGLAMHVFAGSFIGVELNWKVLGLILL